LWESLEEELILGDVSVDTTLRILGEVKSRAQREGISDFDKVKEYLKEAVIKILNSGDEGKLNFSEKPPTVFLVVGVNGVGKTTAIAKMANLFKNEGRKIIIAAADTYRSAAIEQIQHYADRLSVGLVSHQRYSDPAAVVYDSIDKAMAKNIDIIIVDTAGRMHTSYNLMEELKKIKKVVNKKLGRDPDEILMVIDCTTGQNAKHQVEVFNKAISLTGIILTKMDTTSKGGMVLTIKNDLSIPIKIVTYGEKLTDIDFFQAEKFAEILVS
ncbi:MAG: signal recognition particle-docking protein FtsY, partial [Actinobacteria bacterium]|nr:signal recognition particle-docking protein FtsY [Actinomycetota bacterium]